MLTEQETSSLCFDLRETHIDRAKLFDRAESLRRREKQNQASLVYYSIVSSPLIKRESILFYCPKNPWPCCCNRLKKTAITNSIATLLCPHTLSTKKIQERAASKITQQKGSVNYREDSITHCGVAVVNSKSTL